MLKIVKKVTFTKNLNKIFFRISNNANNSFSRDLCNAFLIQGSLAAVSSVEDGNVAYIEPSKIPEAEIVYHPTIDPYQVPYELGFKLEWDHQYTLCGYIWPLLPPYPQPEENSEKGKKLFKTINIPQNIQCINIMVYGTDTATIYAYVEESFVLIYDNGVEMDYWDLAKGKTSLTDDVTDIPLETVFENPV